MTTRTALLIHNPGAGSNAEQSAEAYAEAMASPGTEIRIHPLTEGEDAAAIAREAVQAGVKWIAVAGGDGTVEAVAAELAGGDVPLGVIPAGTYNNFALSLNLPKNPLEASAAIRAGRVKKMDVGFANGRTFFECAGAGLDAALFPLGEEIKGGRFFHWLTLLKRAWQYPRQEFHLTFDRPIGEAVQGHHARHHFRRLHQDTLRISALMVTASNGPYYGMNFTVAPGARLDDGLLTVNVFKRYSKWELMRHFMSISHGRREYCPKAITFRVRTVEISGPRRLHAHMDGTPFEGWPLTIECRPQALPVFVP